MPPFKYNETGFIETQSNIAIPIVDDAQITIDGKLRVLGVINIEHQHPCAFTQIQIDTLAEFARFAAIAIKTYNAKRRLQSLFTSINEATSSNNIMADGPYKTILSDLVMRTKEVAGADGGVKIFALVGEETIERTASEKSNDLNSTRGKNGHTWKLIELARQKGREEQERIVIPNIEEYRSQNYYGIAINPQTIEAKHKALICLPLWFGDEVIGAMWLHYKQPQQFTEEELDELQLYANLSAVALENVKARKILQISEAIAKHNTQPEVIAQRVVDDIKDWFGVLGVIFYVNESHASRLKLFASTKDENGEPHVEIGKIIKYGEGLAGHHYNAEDKDGQQYSQLTFFVPEYNKFVHRIPEDVELKKLESLYSIRLKGPRTEKIIGILILNGKLGRGYEGLQEELERFSNLVVNLLEPVNFSSPARWKRWAWSVIIVIGLISLLAATNVASIVFEDSKIDIGYRLFALIFHAIVSFLLIVIGTRNLFK